MDAGAFAVATGDRGSTGRGVASIAEKSIGSNAVRCGGCDAGFDGDRACCDLVLYFCRTSSASILVAH